MQLVLRKLFGEVERVKVLFLHSNNGETVLPVWSKKSAFKKWAEWYGENVEPLELRDVGVYEISESHHEKS